MILCKNHLLVILIVFWKVLELSNDQSQLSICVDHDDHGSHCSIKRKQEIM